MVQNVICGLCYCVKLLCFLKKKKLLHYVFIDQFSKMCSSNVFITSLMGY